MLHLLNVVWFTFFQAACSTLLALLVGLAAAFFCGRRNFFGRRFLMSLAVVPFCVPTLIIALGYVTFLGLNGGLNRFLMFVFGLSKPPVRILYSFIGLVIAQGFYNFPLIMKNTADCWERLPSAPAESARLLGASEFRIFRTVTIHQLLPSIASSCLLVFIYCFLSFILVLLFGGLGNTTLEVEIYKLSRGSLDFKAAGFLALCETLVLCVVTFLYALIERKASALKGINSHPEIKRKNLTGFIEIPVFFLLITIIVIFFIAPLGGIIVNAFTSPKTGNHITLATFLRVIKMRSFVPAIRTTLIIGACTGFLCTLAGFLYSIFLRFMEGKTGRNLGSFLKVIPMLPMMISSVVVGMLVIVLVKRGNPFLLVITQTALNWPLALRVIYPQMLKISDETLDSGRLLSRNKMDMIFRVLLPVCKGSLINAFGFCFAVSAGDATLPMVLAIPRFNTLSLVTYSLAGAYRFNEACAAGLLLGLTALLVFVVLKLFNSDFKKGKR